MTPRYYGDAVRERSVGHLRIAELDATVPPEDIPEHTHDEAHFILVLRGTYVSSAQHMPETSEGPMLVFNPPGTTHRDRFATAGGRFLSVSMPSQQWAMTPESRTAAAPQRLGFEAMVIAWRLRVELACWDLASPLQLESAGHELLAHAARHAPQRGARPRWLDRVRERLDAALQETPSLGERARDAGVHPVHLSRAFRRHFGCSPGTWLRQARLQRAAALLANDSISVADAAHEAGFFDQSHLHRTLRSIAGLSPASLRSLVQAID